MLVDAYLLTDEQLGELLTKQKESGMKLGDFLIDQGVVTREVIIELLCDQLQIRRYMPEEYEVGPELAAIIPHNVAIKHQIVPLKQEPFVLKIAMVDPLDINALDTAEPDNDGFFVYLQYRRGKIKPDELIISHRLNFYKTGLCGKGRPPGYQQQAQNHE